MPFLVAKLSTFFFQLFPRPLITLDQLKLLKYHNIPSGKYKTNFEIEIPSYANFENEVKNFCKVNFYITFPLTSIYDVKGDNAHEIYKWAKKNYGKKSIPKWNFHKILINKDGKIEDTFAAFTNPTSSKIKKKIEDALYR